MKIYCTQLVVLYRSVNVKYTFTFNQKVWQLSSTKKFSKVTIQGHIFPMRSVWFCFDFKNISLVSFNKFWFGLIYIENFDDSLFTKNLICRCTMYTIWMLQHYFQLCYVDFTYITLIIDIEYIPDLSKK